jgi:hypothetical protein
MKRFCTFLVFIIVMGFSLAAPASDNFPQYQATPRQPAVQGPSAEQQNMFEAYVPPPPIRHSWPGGYRVLIHEVMNTFMDHIVGRY